MTPAIFRPLSSKEVGVRNFLIEGVSGSGKTAAAEELRRRGHQVIHGDRSFAYYGDPMTGEPLDWPTGLSEADTMAWGYRHWIWPLEQVRRLIADQSAAMTFFCGGSSNRRRPASARSSRVRCAIPA